MSYITPEKLAEEAKKKLAELEMRNEPLTPKDRLAIPPQEMPSQDPCDPPIECTRSCLGIYT